MAKYTFRLETLLKLRIADRDRRRTELAEAYQVEQLLQEKAGQLREELNGLEGQSRKSSQPGAVHVDRLLNIHRYELVLRAQAALLDQQRGRVAAEIERRREALARADREVRVLEKLRERQVSEHMLQEARKEGKQIDEIAQRRHAGRS
jgi:flagellar FliJ protein